MNSTVRLLVCALVPAALSGCLFQHTNDDASIRPETAMGSRATIMMPGQGAPPMTVFGQPTGAGSSTSSGSQTGSSQSSSSSGGSSTSSSSGPASTGGSAPGPGNDDGMVMLGGTVGEGDASSKIRQTPIVGPILALVGYPFWAFRSNEKKADRAAEKRGEAYADKQRPGQRFPRSSDDAERMRLEQENQRIREQLDQRATSRGPTTISDELAALERSLGSSETKTSSPPWREALDRDHDGRPDLWSYREDGERSREELDDDHDGRVDRVLHYDETGQLTSAEEDLDHNGSFETVTQYQGGQIARRRSDSDDDGQADSWSFYERGEMVRHEVDRDKDGFRDLILVYAAGVLLREEDDRNRDGRPDLVSTYRDGSVVEKHEDIDFDGLSDVSSYYEHGKLVRRTVSSEGVLEPWSQGPGS